MSENSGFVLELRQLYKSFGSLEVIRNLDLQLPHNQILALIGPSGCGKSTLLNLISGLDKKYNGQIFLSGCELRQSTAQQVGYMLQKDLLLPWRNIEQNVFLPQELHHLKTCSQPEIEKLFTLFGLEQFRKAYPQELSGGMRQRTNLLRTYTLQSELLLLDEPFGSLDALTRQSLQYWFIEMNRKQPRSILLITHDIQEAILLADDILVLSPRSCQILARFTVKGISRSEKLEKEIFSYLV